MKSKTAKRSKRVEDKERQQEIKRVVSAANVVPSYLQPPFFHAFSSYSRNGLEVAITDLTNDSISALPHSRELRDWMFNLTKKNMQQHYEKSDYGWNDKQKRSELRDSDARFLVVSDKQSGDDKEAPCWVAFVHYRFIDEKSVETLYCYEIQVEDRGQRKGLGRFLMQILELIGRKAQMKELQLTVQSTNTEALEFYKTKLGFQLHKDTPSFSSYFVLRKCLSPPPSSSSATP